MKRTAAIATNTFRETIRDRILGVIVLFALAMIVGSLWLASISLGQGARMMKDFGLVAVTAFGLIVAVFVAGSLVRKEVEKRTVFVLFSKPVGRGEFIAGKFLGLAATLFIVVMAMGTFLFGVVWIVEKSPSGMIIVATLLIFIQLAVITAITVFFSTLTSPVLASVWGICFFVAGQLSHNVLALTRLGHNAVTEALSWVVFIVIPNLSAIDAKAAVVGEQTLGSGSIAAWVGYLLAYTVVVLALATWVFRRKEF
jgi:ABC-type transport system involved in multi-copper enzyme maturation permease subunit